MIFDFAGNRTNDDGSAINTPLEGAFPDLSNQTLSPSIVSGGASKNFRTGVSGWQITDDGDAEFNNGIFRGSLAASTIDIGGSDATSFHVDINGNVWSGNATFAGAPFTVTNAGAVTASNMTITGGTISGSTISNLHAGTMPSIQGWTSTLTFSATDYRTIAWTSGTITLTDGTVYNISAGNTGNMAAITYIYLAVATSTTVLQVSATAANSVGTDKILVAVGQNIADTAKSATFQVFGGGGGVGQLLTASNIAANAITANEIATNTITANRMNVSQISAIAADLGSITAGTVTGAVIQTAATGYRLKLDGATNSLNFLNGASNIGHINFNAGFSMEIQHDNGLFLHSSGTNLFELQGDEGVQIVYNNGGGTGSLSIANDTDAVASFNDAKNFVMYGTGLIGLGIRSSTPGSASSYQGYLYYDTTQQDIVFSNGTNWYKLSATAI